MAAPAIGVRRRWAPRAFATVNGEHPLSQGLVSALVPTGATFYDVARSVLLTQGGTNNFGQGAVATGPAATITAATSSSRWDWPETTWLPRSNLSILLVHRKTDSTLRNTAAFGHYSAANNSDRCSVALPFGSGTIFFDNGGTSTTTGGGRLSMGDPGNHVQTSVWVFTSGPVNGPMAIWRNGNQLAYSADRAASRTNNATFCLGNGLASTGTPAASDIAAFGGFAVWNRVIADTEIATLTSDPYCFLRY